MKAKLSFYYEQHFKFPNRNTGFIFKVNVYSMKTCIFLIVILKETLVLMCFPSHFYIIESRKLIVEHLDIYHAKKKY